MLRAKRAKAFEAAMAARLDHMAPSRGASDTHDICTIDMRPALVLARLLDVLGALDPVAHARLTAASSSYRAIPAHAVEDPQSAWWTEPGGSELIAGIVAAINAAAYPYVCDLRTNGNIALGLPVSHGSAPPSGRYRKIGNE